MSLALSPAVTGEVMTMRLTTAEATLVKRTTVTSATIGSPTSRGRTALSLRRLVAAQGSTALVHLYARARVTEVREGGALERYLTEPADRLSPTAVPAALPGRRTRRAWVKRLEAPLFLCC